MRASVTVSIPADSSGMESSTLRVSRVTVLTRLGTTSDSPGCSNTSSNVRPRGTVRALSVSTDHPQREGGVIILPIPHGPPGWRTERAGQHTHAGGEYGVRVQDEPIDPFNGDPTDPAAGLDDLNEDAESEPLTEDERQDVLEDLSDLEIYQALLSPTGIRGLVIECEDCHEPHYFDWDLLRGNLRHLLSSG